ncbi:MAG: hypothetical protein ACK4FF_10305 [Limnobacter sp.]|uniref:hypothetical protein n=1 Tax=Limnobacter sp. TaxID=2003368 RepID=UPI003918B146
MNSNKINLYRINTLQKFSIGDVELSAHTTQKVAEALNSDQIRLLRSLVYTASKLDHEKYGDTINLELSSQPVADTEHIVVNLEIIGPNEDQKKNVRLLIEQLMNFSVFYLDIENKYRCKSNSFANTAPIEVQPIISHVTKEFLDIHFGEKIKSKKFSGVRDLNDLAPCTVLVRKILDDQSHEPTQGLIAAKGIVTDFNRASFKLEFMDQNGERHEINFNQHSFVSHEHESYYHASNPAFNHVIEIAFRCVESKKELLTLEIDPIRVIENSVQYQKPQVKNLQVDIPAIQQMLSDNELQSPDNPT